MPLQLAADVAGLLRMRDYGRFHCVVSLSTVLLEMRIGLMKVNISSDIAIGQVQSPLPTTWKIVIARGVPEKLAQTAQQTARKAVLFVQVFYAKFRAK
jgi:hypothetical protein